MAARTDAPLASPEPVEGRARGSIRRRLAWTLAGFGTLAVAACLFAPLAGSTRISLFRAFDRSIPYADNVDAQIFFIARLPRVLAAALVGSALALAGVVFQALLRNPLASPDTLGVSAGASLGALAVVQGLSTARRRGTSAVVLLLGGVTLHILLSAVIAFVQYLADFTQTFRNVRWLMGSLDVASYGPIAAALLPLVIAWAGFTTLPRVLDLISVGSESAAARGVNVERAERVALVSASLATGAAVALAGPVSFVGIIVPHLVRLIVGADHRLVLPASALFGGAFLITCDLVARTIVAPLELPVGIVTAIVGGPVFLWLLFRKA